MYEIWTSSLNNILDKVKILQKSFPDDLKLVDLKPVLKKRMLLYQNTIGL